MSPRPWRPAVRGGRAAAEPHPGLPDGPVHLAAAFQPAGFRSVIGTLGRAPDTPGTAKEVYAALTAHGIRPRTPPPRPRR